jgi:hypothetical protein
LLKQVVKDKEREETLLREMEEAEQMKRALEKDEKMFNSYAERVLKEWGDAGKNVTPIILEMSKYRKTNLAAI